MCIFDNYSHEYKTRRIFALCIKSCYIPGDNIIQYFADKEVGHCDALVGKMNGVPFHVHVMKEPDYVMMLMSTYGTLTRMGETKKALH